MFYLFKLRSTLKSRNLTIVRCTQKKKKAESSIDSIFLNFDPCLWFWNSCFNLCLTFPRATKITLALNTQHKRILEKNSFCVFIINGFRTIVFIIFVISTTFQPICPPAFFRCLSSSGTYTELRTTSFIESTGVACSDSIIHNRPQVLSIPILLIACSQDWTCNLQMIVSLEN